MTKAAVLTELNGDFEIWDTEIAPPRAGEVAVRMVASGICHSDFSLRSGELEFLRVFPSVIGHEGAGIVEDVGPGVESVKPGDHVVMSFKPFCGRCWYCTHGESYLCNSNTTAVAGGEVVQPVLMRKGDQIIHPIGTATFRELTVVPETMVLKVRDDAPLETVALLGCGVMTGFGAAVNTASIRPGDTVAVIGCGGVGLSAIQGACYAKAGEIIAIDVLDQKLALAESMGATLKVNASAQDSIEAVRELTGGRGADHVFEVIGTETTIANAVQMTRPGGETVLVGLPSMLLSIPANTVSLILENRRIQGSMYGSCDFPRDVNLLLDLYEKKQLKLDEMISHRVPLSRIQEGFDLMAKGATSRTVVVF